MACALAQLQPSVVRRGMIAGPKIGTAMDATAAGFEHFDAGHPSPNAASVRAGQRALELARASRADSTSVLMVLLSGGASAMMAVPADGITIDDKIATARALMNAGVPIDGLNCVRKHLSAIKGGQLAAAARRTVTLAISDVHAPVADDPSVIGSGVTVPDPTTFAAAQQIAFGAVVPDRVRARLARGAAGDLPETPKPGDQRFAENVYEIVGNRVTALEGARRVAETLGYRVIVLDRATDGEARVAARSFVERASRMAGHGAPMCVLAAGETTVTVRGDGLGGRNQEFALAAAPLVASLDRDIVVASVGTDGADGPTDAAGAIVDAITVRRADAQQLDWQSTLARNDAYHFFQSLGDLITWGPTGTNVGDVQLLLTA
jgi:glycerate 2-kinase